MFWNAILIVKSKRGMAEVASRDWPFSIFALLLTAAAFHESIFTCQTLPSHGYHHIVMRR